MPTRRRGTIAGGGSRRRGPPGAAGYYPHEGFYWTDPALLRVLVSSRGELLLYTPGLVLALVFVWRHWSDAAVSGLIVSGLALWYVNAAWWAWWFGPYFGNRAFLELAPLFILGFGAMTQTLARRRGLLLLVATAIVVSNVVFISLYAARVARPGRLLIPAERAVDYSYWDRV